MLTFLLIIQLFISKIYIDFNDYEATPKEESTEEFRKNQMKIKDVSEKNRNNPMELYYLTKSLKKTLPLKEIQENGCHSDLFCKMNSKYLNPRLRNLSERDVDVKMAIKEKDMDYFMDMKINENLEKKYKSRRFNQINQNFCTHLKKEEFDKKEFSYCRKMLLMKRKENLKDGVSDIDEFPKDLRINKLQLQTEAEVTFSPLNLLEILMICRIFQIN